MRFFFLFTLSFSALRSLPNTYVQPDERQTFEGMGEIGYFHLHLITPKVLHKYTYVQDSSSHILKKNEILQIFIINYVVGHAVQRQSCFERA